MDNIIIIAVAALGGLGLAAAIVLYFIASKFRVFEDPKIDEVEESLPSANCGGCGYPGCRAFAEATVKQAKDERNIEGLNCPVGGNDVMQTVGEILGLEVEKKAPLIAVVRCNGSNANSPAKINYEGATSCSFAHALYAGEGGCPNGCLGLGDCVVVCEFDAIHMNDELGLPVVNDKCTACNACVEACPRDIIELRKKGPKGRRVFVSCINEDKGGIAKKNCSVACIGCSKCVKACPHEAITIDNFLAYIDFEKCKLCRECVEVCPTSAIHETNFKPKKPKPLKEVKSKPIEATLVETIAEAAPEAKSGSDKKEGPVEN